METNNREETIYELDIRDDYLFYSNPVSRANTIENVSINIPPGSQMGGPQDMAPSPVSAFGSSSPTRDPRHTKAKGAPKPKRLPALQDPFVRAQLAKVKRHQPWFLGTITLVQFGALIYSFILYAKNTGSPIQTSPFNYQIGPGSGVSNDNLFMVFIHLAF